MTSIRLDMAMSLDGFIAGSDDRPGQEMGRGGFRLFNWLDDRDIAGPDGRLRRESGHRCDHHRPPDVRVGRPMER